MQAIAGPIGEYLYVNVGHAGATGDGCANRLPEQILGNE